MNLINIIAIIGILVGGFLLFKFRKLETLALLAALKAEALGMIVGYRKLEWAVDWLYRIPIIIIFFFIKNIKSNNLSEDGKWT